MATAVRLKNYLEAYNGLEKTRREHEPVWLHQLRAEGWDLFDAAGFPTTHDEDWRFTSLAPLARTQFVRAAKAAVAKEEIESSVLEGAACRLVFVNGRYAAELSDCGSLPAGVTAGSLAAEIERDPAALEASLAKSRESTHAPARRIPHARPARTRAARHRKAAT